MQLMPFNLHECELYLNAQNITIDRKQLLELYFAFGGIPKYLSYIERGKSIAQNINDICFVKTGALKAEFNTIYHALFKNAEKHLSIVHVLAKYPQGLAQKRLLEKAKIPSGGSASKVLQELTESGFIVEIPSFHKKVSDRIYKLVDEYSLFYLTWMKEPLASGLAQDPNYWQKLTSTNTWKSWTGIAFENTCLKHIQHIKAALGIAGVMTTQGAWKTTHSPSGNGAQIDLIIDRADNCINLCEIKFYNQPYSLTQQDVTSLQRKRAAFIQETGCDKTIFITMITALGVNENDHYHQVIDNQITMKDLFREIV